MPRSILSQVLQVEASSTYDDAVSSVHTVGVAEGQTTLEGDMNVVRTLLKDLAGATNWYDTPEMSIKEISDKYFIEKLHQSSFDNVASGTGGSSTAFDTAIKSITGHNNGAGSSTAAGVIVDATKAYKCHIRDHATQNSVDDGSGNEVYGRLSWNGSAYVLTWYSMVSGTETAYSFSASTNLDLSFVAVSRRFEDLDWSTFLDSSFHDTSGISGSIADDNVAVDGMSFLLNGLSTQAQVNAKLDKLGSTANGEGASGVAIEDASSWFTGGNLEAALNEIEALLGSTTSSTFDFSENNVLADDDAVYTALNKLDQKWGDLASTNNGEGASLVGIEDAGGYTTATDVEAALQELYQKIDDVSGWVKVVETTSSPISSGTNHTIPGGATYTTGSGANMDVYFRGVLLKEGSSDDYQEVSSTQISFNFTVPTNSNLTYSIRK